MEPKKNLKISTTSVNKEAHSNNVERSTLFEDYNNSLDDQPLYTPSINATFNNICRCCGRQDCENLDYYKNCIKKLESDTQLAAEIGQGLLNKHETFLNESNQQRKVLENQLEEYKEKIQILEQSLDEVENDKSEIIKEKNKWHWEYQKRQKILDETISDLESTNDKCNQLTKEIEKKSNELEKLRLFKFMMRHSESREEDLTTKLEDLNQELVICRKNELLLTSNIKKLKTKYEKLCNTHEKLLRDFEDRMKSALIINQSNKSNNNQTSTSENAMDVPYNNKNDLIDLIKELSIANTKLKLDLLKSNDQLSDAKTEINLLSQKLEDMNDNEFKHQNNLDFSLTQSENKKESIIDQLNKAQTLPTPTVSEKSSNLPPSTVSEPLSTLNGSTISEISLIDQNNHTHYLEKDELNLVLSPSSSNSTSLFEVKGEISSGSTKSPYILLQEHVALVLERLKGSDIRALNRRLKRAFDITELSSMSNSIIDNILMDVDTLDSRFLWVKTIQDQQKHLDLGGFFPLLLLLKDMLKDLGILRTTMNDLQVEYVKKVEESGNRAEEEVMRKHQLKKQTTDAFLTSSPLLTATKPFSWITSMFYKSSGDHEVASTAHINQSTIDPDLPYLSSDKGSTLTKTTTQSSNMILSPDEDDQPIHRKDSVKPNQPVRSTSSVVSTNQTKRRQRPFFPSSTQPILSISSSTGTMRSSLSTSTRNKRGHRLNIDYEGIGPAAIRPIPSDRD